MNRDILVKLSKWVLYGSIGVLAIAMFFVLLGDHSRYGKGVAGVAQTNDRSIMNGKGIGWGMGGMMSGDDDISAVGGESAAVGVAMPGNMMEEKSIAPSAAPLAADASQNVEGEDRRIVRDGALSIRVEDASWSSDEIDRIVTRLGGFTVSRTLNSEVSGYPMPMMREGIAVREKVLSDVGMPRSGTVTVKVPSEKFSEAITAIRGIAKAVLNESSSADDVTMQFSDLEAQIQNKYAEEAAFTKILNTNTQKVSDILEVTRELSRVRGEIEQLEARKKYMESETDMASITVSLTEDARIGASTGVWRPWQTVKDAVNQLFEQFQNFIDRSIYFLISTLPLFLLYILGLYAIYRIGRGVYRKIRNA